MRQAGDGKDFALTRGDLTDAKKCAVTTNCEKSAEAIVP